DRKQHFVTPYQQRIEISGRAHDGWMSPSAAVIIHQAEARKYLCMQLEIPAALPFKFPFKIRAMNGLSVLKEAAFDAPGYYDFCLPLNRKCIISLKTDQWFRSPVATESRLLSYRSLRLRVRKLEKKAQP